MERARTGADRDGGNLPAGAPGASRGDELARDGYHPVIVGKRDHVEVRGLTEDLADFDVVLSEADVLELRERARFGVAAQTTQPIERVRRWWG